MQTLAGQNQKVFTIKNRNNQRGRILCLIGFTIICLSAVFFLPRLAQDPNYHNFADRTPRFGFPNFLNVISNVGFLLVGLLGLKSLLLQEKKTHKVHFQDRSEKYPYIIFFIGVLLTGVGSSYYHWAPDNRHLVWDRLPMAISFMSLLSAMVAERISPQSGVRLLPALVAFGVGSVLYWYLGELNSRGDLRPYIIVQFYTTIVIPLIILLLPPRYTRGGDICVVVLLYALAKLCEAGDQLIYEKIGLISGHTLKHIIASAGAYWLYRMLRMRAPAPAPFANPEV